MPRNSLRQFPFLFPFLYYGVTLSICMSMCLSVYISCLYHQSFVLYCILYCCSHINGPRTSAIPLTEGERQAIEISEQTAQVVTTATQGAINIIGQDDNGHPIDIHLVYTHYIIPCHSFAFTLHCPSVRFSVQYLHLISNPLLLCTICVFFSDH